MLELECEQSSHVNLEIMIADAGSQARCGSDQASSFITLFPHGDLILTKFQTFLHFGALPLCWIKASVHLKDCSPPMRTRDCAH